MQILAQRRLPKPPEFYRMAKDSFSHEANARLGRALIEHLIQLDANNRWMRKYHVMGSAHGIPQLLGLVYEIYERGTLKAFYGVDLPVETLLFLLCRRFAFNVSLRLSSGVLHSFSCESVEGSFVKTLSSVNLKSQPELTANFKMDISGFIKSWIASGSSIFLMAEPREMNNMGHFKLQPVDQKFDWRKFEAYGRDVLLLREIEQSIRKEEWFRQRRLRKLYEQFAELTFASQDLGPEPPEGRQGSGNSVREFEVYVDGLRSAALASYESNTEL